MPLVDYGKLGMPTHIAHGAFDDGARPEDLALRFREISGNEKQYLVPPGLGHTILIERNRRLLTRGIFSVVAAPVPAW